MNIPFQVPIEIVHNPSNILSPYPMLSCVMKESSISNIPGIKDVINEIIFWLFIAILAD